MMALVGFAWLALLLAGGAFVLVLIGMAWAVAIAARHALHARMQLARLDVGASCGFSRGFRTSARNFIGVGSCIG